ncbi:MAG: transcription elongation factor GreA [Bacilli bacterium]|nr:transcription elongation factor GreA [Bacilli bacterium]
MDKTKEYYLTEQGLEELKKELDELKLVRRPEVVQALKEARALGDLSENAEYDAARTEQAEVEGRIAQLEVMIEKAVIIEKNDNNAVSFGSVVTIKYLDDNEEDTYTIVGTSEVDPFDNKISNESPLAQAIMGKSVGEVATVNAEAGSYEVKILNIK